jgi:NCAIR mutase (PurE)-related protein
MNKHLIEKLLFMVESNEISAASALKELQYDHSDFNLDFNRQKRQGFEEVVYGKSKTVEQIVRIAKEFEKTDRTFLCTGLEDNKIRELEKYLPSYEFIYKAGMVRKFANKVPSMMKSSVAIVTAGTSDSKIAYEASETLNTIGIKNQLFMDIGVAGIHRFFELKDEINKSDVIIVIAGMEGALPSVVGGLFAQPVIAVPSSVGYGTSLSGFTALFAMLTSCAGGICVVNIDNGFGAAMAAYRILNTIKS